ncbi:MAG: hypothetical protein AAF127_03360 [Pseudomonadota bacterium]
MKDHHTGFNLGGFMWRWAAIAAFCLVALQAIDLINNHEIEFTTREVLTALAIGFVAILTRYLENYLAFMNEEE